jgi:hypothetical protein
MLSLKMSECHERESLFSRAGLCVWLAALLMVCLTPQPAGGVLMSSTARPAFLEAFTDFTYVGSGNQRASSVAPHGMQRKPLPRQFKVGRQYIFHYRRGIENEDLLDLLKKRLNSLGVTIHAADGDLNRYMGGLAFRISFEEGSYKGAFYNTLDGQIVRSQALGRQWSFDDYVLVFERVEGAR